MLFSTFLTKNCQRTQRKIYCQRTISVEMIPPKTYFNSNYTRNKSLTHKNTFKSEGVQKEYINRIYQAYKC